jgi:hypothetical protein
VSWKSNGKKIRMPKAKTTSAAFDEDGLNLRESLFVRHFLATGEGKSSAEKAGYKDPAHRASILLRDPRIAKVVARERKKKLSELDANNDRVLKELVYVAFADPRKLFAPDGNSLRPITQLDEGTARSIASLDFRRTLKKGLVSRVRFWSKLGALELIGSFLDMWKGKGDHSQEDRLDEVVAAIRDSPVTRKYKQKEEDD